VSPLGSAKAAALLHEARAKLALRAHWGAFVPPLVAAGAESRGDGFVTATQYIRGRYLDPARDQHLLPQLESALAAAHACGVAHGDLRESNVLVQSEPDGGQRAWLIDWGDAALGASQQDMEADRLSLRGLFRSRAVQL
jgi:tRNA A-37 threonylcarbamoyl transferase component Bud32